MNHTLRQRSQLVQAAERGLNRAERMDALIAKVCIVGLIVYIIWEVL